MVICVGDLIARGSRSSVYAYGRGAIAKVPDASVPDAWVRAEATYSAAAHAAGAPVPRLFGLEQIGGRLASIYERVNGLTLWQQVVRRPDHASEAGRHLAEIQRQVSALTVGLAVPRQRDRLASKIRCAAATVDSNLVSAAEVIPPSQGPLRLCHGDLHPGNVIMSSAGPMVIDWFDATRGDPIADVARTTLLLRPDGAGCPVHLPGAPRSVLLELAEAYLADAIEQSGFDTALLGRWRAVEAVARLAESGVNRSLLAVWHRQRRSPHLVAVTDRELQTA